MIEVRCNKGKIIVTGHAGYAEYGKDIVCSSVSTLLQVFIESMNSLTTDKIKYKIMQGTACIEYGNLSKRGKVLLSSFFIGIRMIADSYPDYVKITQTEH